MRIIVGIRPVRSRLLLAALLLQRGEPLAGLLSSTIGNALISGNAHIKELLGLLVPGRDGALKQDANGLGLGTGIRSPISCN
jgi:hypothetical protein